MNELESLRSMKQLHPDWIWNRSDTHAFVGVPQSHEGMKTLVEPGNSFSPGAGSFGVSTWVFDHAAKQLYAPERMPLDDLKWSFVDGVVPVFVSTWQAGPVRLSSRLFCDGDAVTFDIKDYLTVELTNTAAETADVSYYLVIRSFGAGGGPVKQLALTDDGMKVEVNRFALVYTEEKPDNFGAVSYRATGKDIGQFLQSGELPAERSVEDESTWASGALEYRLSLKPGETRTLHFLFPVKANDRFLPLLQPPTTVDVASAESDYSTKWRASLSVGLEVPDRRVLDCFTTQQAHLLMFTVSDAPRISPIAYPLWWLRDGAYLVVALDATGFHDFAKTACLAVAHRDAYGGFGAEADGPGQSMWMTTQHYLLTRDDDYLKQIWPHVRRKADLLMRMRRTDTPIRIPCEYVAPIFAMSPQTDLVCLPAKDDLIMGRMDMHYPRFLVNGFARLSMERAAVCAEAMGDSESVEVYTREARDIQRAMLAILESDDFGRNSRDIATGFWPTEWPPEENEFIRQRFERHWTTVRCPDGVHKPEKLWTYIEMAQAHNYMRVGRRDRMWVTLDYFLNNHAAPGLYTYSEADGEGYPFGVWEYIRGWDDISLVAPHGWAAAELIMLIRSMMVYEHGDSLVVGAGVPETWMTCGAPIGISNVPSFFGRVSWRYTPDNGTLTVSAERPVPGGVEVHLPGARAKVLLQNGTAQIQLPTSS